LDTTIPVLFGLRQTVVQAAQAVRAAMEQKLPDRTLVAPSVTTPDGVVMAAAEETEAMVAIPEK
jgi:hypothetical protein